jgi:hypothetical protein
MGSRLKSDRRATRITLTSTGVLLGLTQLALAQPSYHLVLLPDEALQVTNAGTVLLQGRTLLEPARDLWGDPIWDADGDGVAEGYTAASLTMGPYAGAHVNRVSQELGIAVGYAWTDAAMQPVLWMDITTVNGDGTLGTIVDLGHSHTARRGEAMDVNARGQVVVRQSDRDHPVLPVALGLVLVNPIDTDADDVPDLWFADDNDDGSNDLMIDLEGTIMGGCIGCPLRINDAGLIAGESNFLDGFVLLPEDSNGDGEPDVWFRDHDGDGVNDLQIGLAGEGHANDISDSGRIVGRAGDGLTDKKYLTQWQVQPSDQVEVVVQDLARKGGAFRATNENLQAVGSLADNRTNYAKGFLWENGQLLELVELLDNPEHADILVPLDIDDTGTIVGSHCWYDRSAGALRCGEGFVAVPIESSPPSSCGDGVCDPGEDECNCAADCGSPTTSEADCTDGIDDDCDGLVDCDDNDDCGGHPACACGAKGDPCTWDSDCCSNDCKPNGTCK